MELFTCDYESLLDRIRAAVEKAGVVDRMKSHIDTDFGKTNNWAGKPFVLALAHGGIRMPEINEKPWYGWYLSNHNPDPESGEREFHGIEVHRKESESDWLIEGQIRIRDNALPKVMEDFLRKLDIDPATLVRKPDENMTCFATDDEDDDTFEEFFHLAPVRRSDATVNDAFDLAIKILLEGE